MTRIEMALRTRLEMGGCYPTGDGAGHREFWFSPHLGRRFSLTPPIGDPDAANAVLRAAGMEEAFGDAPPTPE